MFDRREHDAAYRAKKKLDPAWLEKERLRARLYRDRNRKQIAVRRRQHKKSYKNHPDFKRRAVLRVQKWRDRNPDSYASWAVKHNLRKWMQRIGLDCGHAKIPQNILDAKVAQWKLKRAINEIS